MTTQIDLFNALKDKLGEKETQTLIEYVRGEDRESRENTATKEDVANLRAEVKDTKAGIIKWVVGIVLGWGIVQTVAIISFILTVVRK